MCAATVPVLNTSCAFSAPVPIDAFEIPPSLNISRKNSIPFFVSSLLKATLVESAGSEILHAKLI